MNASRARACPGVVGRCKCVGGLGGVKGGAGRARIRAPVLRTRGRRGVRALAERFDGARVHGRAGCEPASQAKSRRAAHLAQVLDLIDVLVAAVVPRTLRVGARVIGSAWPNIQACRRREGFGRSPHASCHRRAAGSTGGGRLASWPLWAATGVGPPAAWCKPCAQITVAAGMMQ